MTAKDFIQRHSITIIVVLAIFLLLGVFGSFIGITGSSFRTMDSSLQGGSYAPSESYYRYDDAIEDFAPDVEDRKLTHTTTLNTEIEKGEFEDKNDQVHNIIEANNGFVLNENIREQRKAKRGDYNIKVPANNYEQTTGQLKELGEVKHFTENTEDITGQYVDNTVELEAEQKRLERLQKLYDEEADLDDKLQVEKAIFEQERRIQYLQKQIDNADRQESYSTINFNMYEEEPALANVTFVGFGELIKTLISSLEALLYFTFAVLPWLLGIGIIWLLVRWARK